MLEYFNSATCQCFLKTPNSSVRCSVTDLGVCTDQISGVRRPPGDDDGANGCLQGVGYQRERDAVAAVAAVALLLSVIGIFG
jgi:hypothetical protein